MVFFDATLCLFQNETMRIVFKYTQHYLYVGDIKTFHVFREYRPSFKF